MTNEQAAKLNEFLEEFDVPPKWVDEIICQWTFSASHSLAEKELNDLVDIISHTLSHRLRGRFVEKRCGPPKVLGTITFDGDGNAHATGVLSVAPSDDEEQT